MAFRELDQAITDISSRFQYSLGKDVFRTAIFSLSDSLRALEKRFKSVFPQNSCLEPIFPWVYKTEHIGPLLKSAFSLPTSDMLHGKGFRIVDSINQFIFLGDLSEPDFKIKFTSAFQEFQKIMRAIESQQAPSHTIGILILKKISENGEAEDGSHSGLRDSLKEVQGLLDKVIVIDTVNPQGIIIDKAEDLFDLLAHCLHWIIAMPGRYLQEGNLQSYSEWLKRGDLSAHRVTSFTGRSLVLPIGWILNTIAVMKGCEVLVATLLKPDEPLKGSGVVAFVNEININSLDVLKSHLAQNPEYVFPDPLKSMPIWSLDNAREFLQKIDALDASLPAFARDYRDTFVQVAEKLCIKSRLRLDEYLTEIIARVRGGLFIAGAHLEQLMAHLNKLLSEIPQRAAYSDPIVIREKIRSQLDKGPSKAAIMTRTILLAVVVFLGLGALKNGLIKDIILRLLGSGAVGLLGFLFWHSWNARLKRKVIELKNRIHNKWNALLSNEIISAQQETINTLIGQVNQADADIKKAQRRAENLVKFFSSEYLPDRPGEKSFWLSIMVDRAEIIREYLTRVAVNLQESASKFQREEPILESWKRLGNPDEQKPNDWEWSLLERVSLRILPYLEDVMAVSVCQEARSHPEMMERFLQALKKYVDPFIRLKAGFSSVIVKSSIESPQGCGDLISSMKGLLRESTGETRDVESPCRYRLTYFGYADDIALEAIRLD